MNHSLSQKLLQRPSMVSPTSIFSPLKTNTVVPSTASKPLFVLNPANDRKLWIIDGQKGSLKELQTLDEPTCEKQFLSVPVKTNHKVVLKDLKRGATMRRREELSPVLTERHHQRNISLNLFNETRESISKKESRDSFGIRGYNSCKKPHHPTESLSIIKMPIEEISPSEDQKITLVALGEESPDNSEKPTTFKIKKVSKIDRRSLSNERSSTNHTARFRNERFILDFLKQQPRESKSGSESPNALGGWSSKGTYRGSKRTHAEANYYSKEADSKIFNLAILQKIVDKQNSGDSSIEAGVTESFEQRPPLIKLYPVLPLEINVKNNEAAPSENPVKSAERSSVRRERSISGQERPAWGKPSNTIMNEIELFGRRKIVGPYMSTDQKSLKYDFKEESDGKIKLNLFQNALVVRSLQSKLVQKDIPYEKDEARMHFNSEKGRNL